jgi:drug/metabolite transporter (DMT)-like permease
LLVVALTLCVVPFLLFAWAQQYVPSSIASILNATTPLMTMLVAISALPSERPTRSRLTGLLLGFAGVFIVLAPWQDFEGGGELGGFLACMAATTSYGVAFVYLRRFVAPHGLPAVPVATVQVSLGAAVMLLLAPFTAFQPVTLTPGVVLSTLALGVIGTGLAYVWNTNIVTKWGATPASTVTYLTPLVGVVLGVTFLGEQLGWNHPLGAIIIILGILVSQERLRPLLHHLRIRSRTPVPRTVEDYEV